ncbi:MAG: T9SS type A sorting domain-containing protein [Sphingobacteriales bacterium]|nr:MAG: T9SS type A sorting domain-containing protein [Sphingobacteriales bacterium]
MKRLILSLSLLWASFPLAAQTTCDSVAIEVQFAPFDDSLIIVSATNQSQEIFSYPGFILFNNSGDTLAIGSVNLFGLGQSSSQTLSIQPAFSGTAVGSGVVQLWTNFYDSLHCTFPITGVNLCPDTCVTLYPSFANSGGAMVTGNVSWTLTNSMGQAVGSGTLEMDSLTQEARDSICINPGSYSISFTQGTASSGGQQWVGVSTAVYGGTVPMVMFNGTSETIPFSFYSQCSLPTTVQDIPGKKAVQIYAAGGSIRLNSLDGTAIGAVRLVSINGSLVVSKNFSSETAEIIAADLVPGIYIVQVQHGQQVWVEKVLVNP